MTGPSLVTGASGFAGSHLLDHLLEHESAVAAWGSPDTPLPVSGSGGDTVSWDAVDLLDRAAVLAALARVRPSAIYHCAGAADVAASWRDPAATLRVNAIGTHHLLEAVRRTGLRCRVLVICSAAVYRPSAEALAESSPLGPASPYGFSKLAQEMLALAAAETPVLVARPFNHFGPRQSPAYVTAAFAQQIADIETGRREPVLRVGNLEARRDLTDVRDVVRAYRLLLQAGEPRRPYNVCSGRAYRIRDLLDALLALSTVPIHVEPDPARQRPADTPVVLGDHGALTEAVGWTPSIAVERTLADLLDYWRAQAGAAS